MRVITLLFFSFYTFLAMGQGFEIKEQKQGKKIDILYNGKLLTSYCYFDSIKKPFLHPINTVDGVTVTRGYPISPVLGERTDHPHHTGLWLNYESVNGLDFWNNSTAIAPEKRDHYGTIVHKQVLGKAQNKNEATLSVAADWNTPDGKTLLKENTEYSFSVRNNTFYIIRTTTLKAQDQKVVFKDVKDGLFAIRVASELEMPSKEPGVYYDVHGKKTTVAPSAKNVTGKYYSSEGLSGDSVWGTKGKWVMLKGEKDGKKITIGILDHPTNVGYPSYWHARGYGLFAVNPLGRKIFSNGKEELNYSLEPNKSVTFKYELLVASDVAIDDKAMNEEEARFSSAPKIAK
jgi:hypothetical protein